ncbi:MAG: exopolysaccharide biosynthesis protein exod [Brevundimonas sp.]|uniref:Exopolysaccharide biosynthesis protein n=1 Tax=Brevundimonas albigilva TaxID=1312364 RepID=A0ABY4SMI8_9CAUL|nr:MULTISPECIES: exopolysaccharide biosynthesis protein [Brevundimonas]PZU58672.1 MAG: exopolysaccharide biosynthesis protein exod [Brevundimonas sp.]UQV19603.1 exopolysaccharide biosynthesis protein [Brevundimonas albigilva]URI15478.1 exopolysaccharide biosynthesis protein [Brevundimonas albigilva]
MTDARTPEQKDDVSHNVTRLLRRLADDGGDRGLTLHEIRDRMDERAYGLLILLLSIPCLVPGLYGVPQVVGVIIILVAAQLLVGREEPWLPRCMLDLRARGSWLKAMADFAESKLSWIDRLSRPRLTRFADGPGEKLAAVFMILATLTIVLPMTNTIPSIALALLSVGLIQRDGLFVIAGAAVATAWLTLLGALAAGLLLGAEWATRLLPG